MEEEKLSCGQEVSRVIYSRVRETGQRKHAFWVVGFGQARDRVPDMQRFRRNDSDQDMAP